MCSQLWNDRTTKSARHPQNLYSIFMMALLFAPDGCMGDCSGAMTVSKISMYKPLNCFSKLFVKEFICQRACRYPFFPGTFLEYLSNFHIYLYQIMSLLNIYFHFNFLKIIEVVCAIMSIPEICCLLVCFEFFRYFLKFFWHGNISVLCLSYLSQILSIQYYMFYIRKL